MNRCAQSGRIGWNALPALAMQYPDSVEFLYALGNEIKSVKFGWSASAPCSARSAIPNCGFRLSTSRAPTARVPPAR